MSVNKVTIDTTDFKVISTTKGYDLYIDGRLTHTDLSKQGLLEIIGYAVG